LNARTDFLDFLAEASGTHAFSLASLQFQRGQFQSLPIMNPENPDPMIAWGEGDPNILGTIKSRPGWQRSRYLKNTEHGGICSRYLGWAWITLVFDRWEDDFRHRFAGEMNCSHGQVMCDAMGDLRHLRHDVTHNKGIATREESGRCALLREWFTVGSYIEINISRVSQFYDLISSNQNSVYVRTDTTHHNSRL
jgi:hypothetical protein